MFDICGGGDILRLIISWWIKFLVFRESMSTREIENRENFHVGNQWRSQSMFVW